MGKDRADQDLLSKYLVERRYLAILSMHDIEDLYRNSQGVVCDIENSQRKNLKTIVHVDIVYVN